MSKELQSVTGFSPTFSSGSQGKEFSVCTMFKIVFLHFDNFPHVGPVSSRFVNVVYYRNHENWKQNLPGSSNHENGYDISILELAIDLDLKTYTPACLAKYNDKLANWQSGIAVGWGAIKEFPWKNYPEVPHEVSLEIEPRNEAECRNPKNGNKFCQ